MKKRRGLGRIKKGSHTSEKEHRAILFYIEEGKGHLIRNRRLHQVYIFELRRGLELLLAWHD